MKRGAKRLTVRRKVTAKRLVVTFFRTPRESPKPPEAVEVGEDRANESTREKRWALFLVSTMRSADCLRRLPLLYTKLEGWMLAKNTKKKITHWHYFLHYILLFVIAYCLRRELRKKFQETKRQTLPMDSYRENAILSLK